MVGHGAIGLKFIISNFMGGLIAMLVAVVVSRWEAKRQARDRKQNWYRTVHITCARAFGGQDSNHRGVKDTKLREYAQLYRAFSEQIETQLADAPTDEVRLPLFNALQNIQLSCIRYANEVQTPNPDSLYLQRRHETVIEYSQIVMYVIENEKSPDIELLYELDGDELEEAEKKYTEFINGTIYDEQNKRVKQTRQRLEDID